MVVGMRFFVRKGCCLSVTGSEAVSKKVDFLVGCQEVLKEQNGVPMV